MKQKTKISLSIKNKKAYFHYHLLETYTAGIQLLGWDIKLVRAGKVGISEAYCNFIGNELFVTNMHLAEHNRERLVVAGNKTARKLMLNRNELNKLQKRITEKGLTIIPLRMFLNDAGLIKLEISLAKGKRKFDKRYSIKTAESKRELDHMKKRGV